jgi:catechol 2,3-dioxygenase-like lactoylglutathione lyase family enzyme
MRFEVTTFPVADVDRAKAFYQGLGWRLDIDYKPDEHTRSVQFTPPGSLARSSSGRQNDDDRFSAGPVSDRRGHRGRP